MRMKTVVWLIVAASLLLLGGLLFTGAMVAIHWDFEELSTVKYETNHYTPDQSYENILIVTNTADVTLVMTEEDRTEVVCYEESKIRHTVWVEEDTLHIEVEDTRKWYEHIGVSFGNTSITIFLPKDGSYKSLVVKEDTGDVSVAKELGFESIDISTDTGDVECYASVKKNMKIATDTGDIRVEDLRVDALELTVSTGKITASRVDCRYDTSIHVSTGDAFLTDLTCYRLTSTGSTGHLTLKNVIARETFSITRSTGDVRFEACDADTIYVKTNTGDVTGSLLTEKSFFPYTSTGDVDLPRTTVGGRCEITTSTGDIKITINK